MREEARLYSWMTDKLTGRVLTAPVDAYNHGWDAVRYATESAQVESAMEDDDSGGVLVLKIW
jgi:phage terminase large subunit